MEGVLDRKMTEHQPGGPCVSGWVLDAFWGGEQETQLLLSCS